jgi:hypothetical protein
VQVNHDSAFVIGPARGRDAHRGHAIAVELLDGHAVGHREGSVQEREASVILRKPASSTPPDRLVGLDRPCVSIGRLGRGDVGI